MRESTQRLVRTLFVVHLVAAAGFSLVVPFLPLYVKTLRGDTPGTVTLWASIVFSAPALTMMVAAPVWGIVADRYGRKLMLVRSTFCGAIVLFLMGTVHSVTALALLRGLQGALTGYLAASNALVAASVARSRAGAAFGTLRTGSWIGLGIGPLLGGVLADIAGVRASFFVTGALLAAVGLLVVFTIEEGTVGPTSMQSTRVGLLGSVRLVLGTPALGRLYLVSFVDSFARSALSPVIPLFLLRLVGARSGVASLTGVLLGLRATAGAISSLYVGRLGDRIGHGRVVFGGALLLTLIYAPQALVTSTWQLVSLQALAGVAAVGLVPGIGALLSLHAPSGQTGATFGVESSLDALARTLGPLTAAGIVYLAGQRTVFAFVAIAHLALTLLALPLRHIIAEPEGSAA